MTVKLKGVKRVRIHGDYIKLDSLLKLVSIASTGGMAKLLIKNGEVLVDGAVCYERGKKIRNGGIVRYKSLSYIVKTTDSESKLTEIC